MIKYYSHVEWHNLNKVFIDFKHNKFVDLNMLRECHLPYLMLIHNKSSIKNNIIGLSLNTKSCPPRNYVLPFQYNGYTIKITNYKNDIHK